MGKINLHNDGKHIRAIVTTTTCKKHKADEGTPCYVVHPGTGKVENGLLGVCGARIKRAGYNGTISETSFQTKRPSGPSEGRKTHHKKKEAA